MWQRERAKSQTHGFGYGLTETFPSQVIVDATELCNLACTHCPHPAFKTGPHYAGRSLEPKLSAKIVDEIRQYGIGVTRHLRYTGEGEPLIHPQIFSMLSYAASRSGVFVSVTTNGTLLTEDRIDRLLSTGVGLIDISIDAFAPDTYAKIRVNGDLEVTRGNTLALLRAARSRPDRPRIVVSYIEQPANAGDTESFEAFWRMSGVDSVVIRRMHSGSGAIVPVASLVGGQAASPPRRPCLYPWERVVLTPRGRLAYCPSDWSAESELADYRTTTVQEVWKSSIYLALREAQICSDFSDHAFCGQCPDWALTRWPHEGRRYADLVGDFKATA